MKMLINLDFTDLFPHEMGKMKAVPGLEVVDEPGKAST